MRRSGILGVSPWAVLLTLGAAGLVAWFAVGEMDVPTTLDDTNSEILTDDKSFVSVRVPKGWKGERPTDPDSLMRLQVISPDRSIVVGVFAIHTKGTIDLEKFLDADRKVFPELGALQQERTVRNYLYVYATERVYAAGRNALYSTARFKVSGSYGYVAMTFSRSPDVSAATPILDSLDPNVPLGVRARDKIAAVFSFENFFGSIAALVLSALILVAACALLYPFGMTGLQIRRGFLTLKVLRAVRREIEAQNNRPNSRFFSTRRAALLRAFGIPFGWLVAYSVLFSALPKPLFLLSLVGLAAVALGVKGWFFVPGDLVDESLQDFVDA
jgi:hypothetical protein